MPANDDDTLLPFSLPSICQKKVTAAFDGGRISSDGGVLLLAGADKRLGLIDPLAAIIPDHRDPDRITHTMADILRARIFAIACGYPDADDLDDLRKDPAFKLACGRRVMPPKPGRIPAGSWRGSRRRGKELDARYVVTNITYGTAAWLYDSLYCARGQAENLIQRHKSQLASDRTSCRSPLANQMRLILHTAAYWLMRTLRDAIPVMQPLAIGEFSTIRLRLLKIAVRIKKTATRIRLAFAANCPDAALFRELVGALIPRPT